MLIGRVFHKLYENGNIGNIGTRGFTMCKQKNQQQNTTPVSLEPRTSAIPV